MKDIVLTTINAKWIHPSLALRLLKANLTAKGSLSGLEDRCEIIEFALRQPLAEKLALFIAADKCPRILGISVSIWNHTATIELLDELKKIWTHECTPQSLFPIIIMGGPEVSHLPPNAEIFRYADFVIRGEGEIAFRELCENILTGKLSHAETVQFIDAGNVDVSKIKSAYHLYTDEDIAKKLIYVEASRGCPFNCEFCLSNADKYVREFPLEPFLAEIDELIRRGAKTLKFLDRSFNMVSVTTPIYSVLLQKLTPYMGVVTDTTVHFEMNPSLFPPELLETLARFPPGSLRLEIGIQTLNREVAARIGRPSNPAKELETLRLLREKTHAIIHADLIAGLPGEDLASFGRGFDQLWEALTVHPVSDVGVFSQKKRQAEKPHSCGFSAEIQLGILKLLPGAPIARHSETFAMRYNPLPPYDVLETSAMSADDIARIKNFARFWELIVNQGLLEKEIFHEDTGVFDKFMRLSDSLYAHFGRNWGIDREELKRQITDHIISVV